MKHRDGEKVYTNPRVEKLGVRPNAQVLLVGDHDADFLRELEARDFVEVPLKGDGDAALVFVRTESLADLGRLPALVKRVRKDGALWTIRPKGRRDITEAHVLQAGLDAGMVDVKVVRFSDTHTANKFVFRLVDR